MIKFFFEAAVIYLCLKLCVWLRLFSWYELKEFGIFCGALVLLFLFARFLSAVGDKLQS